MTDYSQPDFYRLNSDSLDLVNWVARMDLKVESLLDLGSGCGVIGLEYHLRNPVKELTLVEPQEGFLPHLNKNIEGSPGKVIQSLFSEFYSLKRFDLILCNPPYYLPGEGQPSKDPARHMARSFVKDNWEELLSCVVRSLRDQGKCFMVIKDLKSVMDLLDQGHPGLEIVFHREKPGTVFLELTRLDVE